MVLRRITRMILSILLVVIIPSFSNAQIKLGLNGGIDIASYNITNKAPDATFTNKVGLSVGGIFDIPIIERFNIRLLAKYNQRGGENTIPVFGNVKNKIYFDYIELAPYAVYLIVDDEILAKVMGGISFGHLVNAKAISGSNEFGIKDDYYLSNVTADFGVEFELPALDKISLIANGIYSLGLKNISKNGGELKTKDVQVSIGFLYKIL